MFYGGVPVFHFGVHISQIVVCFKRIRFRPVGFGKVHERFVIKAVVQVQQSQVDPRPDIRGIGCGAFVGVYRSVKVSGFFTGKSQRVTVPFNGRNGRGGFLCIRYRFGKFSQRHFDDGHVVVGLRIIRRCRKGFGEGGFGSLVMAFLYLRIAQLTQCGNV